MSPAPPQVYATAYVDNCRGPEGRRSGVNTILINPVEEAREFSRVLKGWVAKDDKWATARVATAASVGETELWG